MEVGEATGVSTEAGMGLPPPPLFVVPAMGAGVLAVSVFFLQPASMLRARAVERKKMRTMNSALTVRLERALYL
jgi:hypothetical protein